MTLVHEVTPSRTVGACVGLFLLEWSATHLLDALLLLAGVDLGHHLEKAYNLLHEVSPNLLAHGATEVVTSTISLVVAILLLKRSVRTR